MAGYEKPRQRVNNSAELYSRMMARRAMYGGGGGAGGLESGIEGFGSDLGRGIYQAITRGKQNAAAESEMQQYNTLNPPRADLVSVPGESVADWSKQNPNIPTEQSTIPAPSGQGAIGLQNWMQMNNMLRAQDTAQQQAAMRGMQMAEARQRMQLGDLTIAQKYQALQNSPNKLPPGTNADINKIAAANAMAKQYTGLTLEDVTKNPQDWHLSEDKTFVTNDTLSKYYNRQIAVPPDVWTKASPQMMAAGAILQRYRNTPLGPEIDRQLGLSRGGQPNVSEPQGEHPMQSMTAESVGTPPQVQRAQPSAGGIIPQTPTNQQVLPPSSNMQSDYFRQNPQGATPMTPNPASTGAQVPVAGQTGKQQSPADEYILRAIGGAGGGQ